MPSSTTSQQKPSLTLFLDRVTIGISKSEFLLDSVLKIQEHNGSVFVVAVPKAPDLLEELKEALVERIREMPEELGLIFSAKAQANEIGGRTHLIIRLTPKKQRT